MELDIIHEEWTYIGSIDMQMLIEVNVVGGKKFGCLL
jgi:hypothetical protein